MFSGEQTDALKVAEEGATLAANVGHIGTESLCLRVVAMGHGIVDADLDELERVASSELAVYEAISSPWIALSHAWLSTLQIARGRFDTAHAPRRRVDPAHAAVVVDRPGGGREGYRPRAHGTA